MTTGESEASILTSLLRVTFLIKRYILLFFFLFSYIRLIKSRRILVVLIERGNEVIKLMKIIRPKLKRLIIHFLNLRTSLIESDDELNLQAMRLKIYQVR